MPLSKTCLSVALTLACFDSLHIIYVWSLLHIIFHSSFRRGDNIVAQKLPDTAQEESHNETQGSKGDADPIRVAISLRERFLARPDDEIVAVFFVGPRDQRASEDEVLEFRKFGVAKHCNGGYEESFERVEVLLTGRHYAFADHGIESDARGGVFGKLVHECVVVGGKADGAANVPDTERDGGDGADKLDGTDNLCNDA